VLPVAQHELALVVSAPQPVGIVSRHKWGTLGLVAFALPALDEAIAIEHGVNRADGRWLVSLMDFELSSPAGTPANIGG
jgi:hypothetical protein